MKRHYRIPLLLCSLCTASLTAVAQNTTNLPTSMYGVGELSAGDGGRYAGMGNTGIALNRTGFLNTLNPAAITRMDTACFTFDVGVSASYARYSFLSEHSSNFRQPQPHQHGLPCPAALVCPCRCSTIQQCGLCHPDRRRDRGNARQLHLLAL